MANNFYTEIFAKADLSIDFFLSSTISDVAAAVTPIAQKMLLLYVILWGFAAYRGLINEYIMDGVFRILKVIVVMTFATNVALYSGTIADNIIELPDYLSSIVGGGNPTESAKNTLDRILDDGLETGSKYWDQGSLNPLTGEFAPIVLAIFTWLAVFLSTAYAAFLMILSKMALAVLVGIGPLFIIMLMFDSTKKFFEAWLAQVMNFAFVSFLTVAVVKLIFTMLASTAATTNLAASGADNLGIWTIATLILMSLIGLLVLMQVMGVASGLGGGMALSTMGAAGAAMGAAGRAAGSLNKRKTDRERKDPTTWTSAAGTASRNAMAKVTPGWARRSPPNSIKNQS